MLLSLFSSILRFVLLTKVIHLHILHVSERLQFYSFIAAPNYSFMRDATGSPTTSYYDYIIVGGGTAGCPLAATLSQNASVLLLERGGSPYNNPNITRLSAFGAALSDLSEASPSQRFISEDGVINARARVLGGGSALNAGFYTRAGTKYVRLVNYTRFNACICIIHIHFKYVKFSLFTVSISLHQSSNLFFKFSTLKMNI